MFFLSPRSIAVFPPTEESTAANNVVGICTNFIPRRNIDAANPDMSPTTPPPSANIQSERVISESARKFKISIWMVRMKSAGK